MQHRRHMARRIGCALVSLLAILSAAGTALVWLLLSVTGAVGSAPVGRILAGAGLVLGAVAIAVAVLAVRRLTAPAARIVEAAQRIEAGDFSARLAVRGPSELRSVARAFNAMSGRLEAEEARRRSVLADVAHEMRTPITVIRAQAEGIVDGVYTGDAEHMRPVLASTRSLEVLVDDLRTLALAEAGGLRLQREAVEVGVLVQDTIDTFAQTARAQGTALLAAVDPPSLTIDADPVRLRSVLANLVSNALRHTPRGGTVTIAASAGSDGKLLAVRDDGEGIPADLLPRVFDRFVKSPASGGSGLGLAIVRDIVEAHGGTVAIGSEPGRGTEVTVRLPTA